jgi:hypothetical protein
MPNRLSNRLDFVRAAARTPEARDPQLRKIDKK